MEHLFAKNLKTGDPIIVCYSSSFAFGFYCENEKGNYYWSPHRIIWAYNELKEGKRKIFKPHVDYLNSGWENRIAKFNMNELSDKHWVHRDAIRAYEILKELNIIKDGVNS